MKTRPASATQTPPWPNRTLNTARRNARERLNPPPPLRGHGRGRYLDLNPLNLPAGPRAFGRAAQSALPGPPSGPSAKILLMQNPSVFTSQSPPNCLQNGPKTGPEFDEIMKNEWLLPVKVDFALFVFFNMFFSSRRGPFCGPSFWHGFYSTSSAWGPPRSAKRPSKRACFGPSRRRCPKEAPWRAPRDS